MTLNSGPHICTRPVLGWQAWPPRLACDEGPLVTLAPPQALLSPRHLFLPHSQRLPSTPLFSSLTSFSCSRLSTLDHSSIWVSTFRGSSKWFTQHPLLLTCLAAPPPPQHTHLGGHSLCCHASFTLCERLGGSWLTLAVPTMDPPSIPMCSAGLQATKLGVSASAPPEQTLFISPAEAVSGGALSPALQGN